MDQNKKPLNKKLIAGVVALIAVIAILLGVYLNNRQPTTSGSKTITVSVFDTVSIHTKLYFLCREMRTNKT